MGFGRGKVILFGEHAVVYGVPALAAGIERGVEATATRSSTTQLLLSPWDQTITPGDAQDNQLATAFAQALRNYQLPSPVEVACEIALPAGAGLGCSAALGVAVLSALDEFTDTTRSPEQLAEQALGWEQVFHGNPSGVDNTVAACGGLLVFQKGQPLRRPKSQTAITLVVGHSGQQASTKETVAGVARQYEENHARVGKVFEGIEAIVRNAEQAVVAGDLHALGELMDLNHALLSSLMLCTGELERMCRAARDAGALGAKLTGGGGGGCMIALASGDDAATKIEDALRSLDKSAFITRIAA